MARLLLAPLAVRNTSQAAHQLQLACVLKAASSPGSCAEKLPSESPAGTTGVSAGGLA